MPSLKLTKTYEKYLEYKDSGIPWIGDIPKDWKVSRGKNLFKKMARKPLPNDEIVTAFRDGTVTLRKNRREDGFTMADKEIGYQRILKGDLVIHGMDAFAGAIGVSDSNGKASPVYSACQPLKKNSSKYYSSLLRQMSKSGYIFALAKGIRERSTEFRYKEFSTLELLVPPASSQVEITSLLDTKVSFINQIIEKKHKLIDLLSEKRSALITHAVTKGPRKEIYLVDSGKDLIGYVPKGWRVEKLKYVAKIYLGKMLQNENKGSDYFRKYLKAQNIRWESVDVATVDEMWFSKNELNQHRIQKKDLLVSEGGDVGRTAIWENELEECYVQNSINRVTVNKNVVDPYYLLMVFEYFGKSGLFDKVVNRVSIAHLTREKLKEIYVMFPDLDEQEKIVFALKERMKTIDKSIQMVETQIEKLTEYRSSLIYHAVTGKIKI